MKKLIFVTSNNHKLSEAKDILSEFEVIKKPLEITEIQGNLNEICQNKSLQAFLKLDEACFVEDTSLIFQAWTELPGPYIKPFLQSIGPAGLYQMLLNFDNKKATAIATIGFMNKKLKEPLLFQGRIEGVIVSPRGTSGFEWDQIFVPEGYDKTFAELGMTVKNQLSHRKKALALFKDYLVKNELF